MAIAQRCSGVFFAIAVVACHCHCISIADDSADREIQRCKSTLRNLSTAVKNSSIRAKSSIKVWNLPSDAEYASIPIESLNSPTTAEYSNIRFANWGTAHRCEITELRDGTRQRKQGLIARGRESLSYFEEGNNSGMTLSPFVPFHEFAVLPFFGIFDVSSQTLEPRFERWAEYNNWFLEELSEREPKHFQFVIDAGNGTARLKFDTDCRLLSVLIDEQRGASSKQFTVDCRLLINFGYDKVEGLPTLDGIIPTSFVAEYRHKADGTDGWDPMILLFKTQLLDFSRDESPFTKWGEVLKDIPDGIPVQVLAHRGVEFEWRDGDVVRVIDRKKLDSIRQLKFVGSRWFLLVSAIVVALVCFVAFKRFGMHRDN